MKVIVFNAYSPPFFLLFLFISFLRSLHDVGAYIANVLLTMCIASQVLPGSPPQAIHSHGDDRKNFEFFTFTHDWLTGKTGKIQCC